MSDARPPEPAAPMSEDAFRALCLMYHANELDEAGFAALTAELDASATRRSLFVEVSMQIETVYEAFEQKNAEQTAVELGITDDEEDVEDEDAFDIMTMVVDQALALRRQHEVEDEANQQLASQQHEDARNRRFEMRRHAETAPVMRQVVIPQAIVWLSFAAVLGIVATVAFQFNRSAPQTTTPPIVEQTPDPMGPTPRQIEPAPVFATLVRTLDARWADDADAWDGGLGLREGQHMLAEGLVEIELAEGTRVVLEAPVSFELTGTNAMSLDSGRLVAHVPPSGYGFTVDTPTARIVDYGTEFGVEVADGDRATQVHVFQGEVRAAARRGGQIVDQPVPLYEREGAVIDAGAVSVARVAFDAEMFERRVVRRLDLVDLVAGGDGLGDRAGNGIDLTSGRYLTVEEMAARPLDDWKMVGGQQTHRVPGNDLIDCIFVIDRLTGRATISSEDDQFNAFPTTGSGVDSGDTYGFIQAAENGPISQPDRPGDFQGAFASVQRPDLDGRSVVVHSGAGLTLDLQAIARRHGGDTPQRFTAYALNIEALLQERNLQEHARPGFPATADLWVFVDGEPRFKREGVDSADGVIEIDIPLKPTDRFLTLAVSHGGDGIFYDWVLVSRPTIEIGDPSNGPGD